MGLCAKSRLLSFLNRFCLESQQHVRGNRVSDLLFFLGCPPLLGCPCYGFLCHTKKYAFRCPCITAEFCYRFKRLHVATCFDIICSTNCVPWSCTWQNRVNSSCKRGRLTSGIFHTPTRPRSRAGRANSCTYNAEVYTSYRYEKGCPPYWKRDTAADLQALLPETVVFYCK